MTRVLSLSTAVSFLALRSCPPRLCHRFFGSSRFRRHLRLYRAGVASLPDLDVDTGPLGAGVYVEPGVAFMSPAMDYASPASTWAPVYPHAQLEVVPAEPESIEFGPAAMGAETGQ